MIARARLLVMALVGLPLLMALLGLSGFIDLPEGGRSWVAPATLLGLVSPVIGYRLFALMQERAVAPRDENGFFRATLAALAVTELVALLGWVVHLWSGEAGPLAGLLAHVLLAGALWPTPERLEAFLDGRR